MSWRRDKDLADLLKFSARIFVAIRAECPGRGSSHPDDASRLRTIEAYADAAHNLDRIAEALLCAGQPGAPERIAMEADNQLWVLRDIVARLPQEASYTRWTWNHGISILERIKADCFTPLDCAPIEQEKTSSWEDELDHELMGSLGIQGSLPDASPSPEPQADFDLTTDWDEIVSPDINWVEEVPDQADPGISERGPQEQPGRMIDLLIAQERAKEKVDLEETVREQADRIRQLERSLDMKTAASERFTARESRIETVKQVAASFGRRDHIIGNRTLQDEFGRRISHLDRMSEAGEGHLARGASSLLSSLSMIAWPESRTPEATCDILADATNFRVQELSSAYEGVRDALRMLKDEVAQAGQERAGIEALLAERGGLLAIHQNRILREIIGQLIADSPILDRHIWRKQVRTAFEREGIAPTLGEFNARSETEILEMYGVGPSSYEAVVEELVQAGIPSFHVIEKLARKPGRPVPDYRRIIRELTGHCEEGYIHGPSETDLAFIAASEDAIRKAHLRVQDLIQMTGAKPSETHAQETPEPLPKTYEERISRLNDLSDAFE